MPDRIRLEPVDAPPRERRVYHYDELSDAAQAALPAWAGGRGAPVPESGRRIDDRDVVKFTDYYRVRLSSAE